MTTKYERAHDTQIWALNREPPTPSFQPTAEQETAKTKPRTKQPMEQL